MMPTYRNPRERYRKEDEAVTSWVGISKIFILKVFCLMKNLRVLQEISNKILPNSQIKSYFHNSVLITQFKLIFILRNFLAL